MSRKAEVSLRVEPAEGRTFEMTWSRSRKRLIATVTTPTAWAQAELTPAQVEKLARFLGDGNAPARSS